MLDLGYLVLMRWLISSGTGFVGTHASRAMRPPTSSLSVARQVRHCVDLFPKSCLLWRWSLRHLFHCLLMGIWRFYGKLSALLLLYLFGLFVMMVYTTSLSLRTFRRLALLWHSFCMASSLSLRPFRDGGLYYIFIAAYSSVRRCSPCW